MEEELLRAVLLDPADDAPRLIYADWLEDHGQPDRARFIHTAVLVQRDRPGPDAHADALAECGFNLHDVGWSGLDRSWYDGGVMNLQWDRGFVSGIACSAACFFRRARAIFSAQPIVVVDLQDRRPRLEEGLWGWLEANEAMFELPRGGRHFVSPALMQPYLVRRRHDRSRWDGAFFASPELALAALCESCVEYGRVLAELPPLPTR